MRVSARAIIFQEGKLLTMFRRKFNSGELTEYYVIPGGGQDDGETLEEAVTRELKEEMSIDIKVVSFLGNEVDKMGEANYFYCEILSGTPKLGGEELERNSQENYYEPRLLKLEDIETVNLYGKNFVEKAIKLISKSGYIN